MAFRPLHDRVVVQALDSESKPPRNNYSGYSEEKPSQGKVVSVGPSTRDNDSKSYWLKSDMFYTESILELKLRLMGRIC